MFGNKLKAVEKAIKKNNAKALINLASSKQEDVDIAAIAGLGEVGGEEATNFLITSLRNEDPKIRMATVQAMGVLHDEHTKAFLSLQMEKETDPKIREAMVTAMAKIKDY